MEPLKDLKEHEERKGHRCRAFTRRNKDNIVHN